MSFSAKIVKAQYRNTFDLRWHVLDKAAQIPYSCTYEELTATLDWNCGGLTTHCVMVRWSYNQVFNVTRSQHECSPIEPLWYFLVYSRTMIFCQKHQQAFVFPILLLLRYKLINKVWISVQRALQFPFLENFNLSVLLSSCRLSHLTYSDGWSQLPILGSIHHRACFVDSACL